jgi:hypothetical protein
MSNPPLAIDPNPILSNSFLSLVDERVTGLYPFFTEVYQVALPPPLPEAQPNPFVAMIRLRESPAHLSASLNVNVVIPGYSETLSTPSSGDFLVDYETGDVFFNTSEVGNNVVVTYQGTGSIVTAADVNNITIPLVPFYNKLDNIVPDGGGTFTFPNNVVVSSPYTITGAGSGISGLMQRYDTVATASQTVFTPGFAVTSSSTLVYSDGLLMTQGGSADYTITGSGTTITFNEAKPLGEPVSIIKIGI